MANSRPAENKKENAWTLASAYEALHTSASGTFDFVPLLTSSWQAERNV
jgi:hypothetical protein